MRMIYRSLLLASGVVTAFLSVGCATDPSNVIMKNPVLAASPGNRQKQCQTGYVYTCKTSQEQVVNCYCLDQDVLRDVLPPDPAR